MHRCFTIPRIFHQQRDKAPLSFLAKWNCKTHTHAPLCPSPEAKQYTEIPRDIHLTQDYEIILVTGFPEKSMSRKWNNELANWNMVIFVSFNFENNKRQRFRLAKPAIKSRPASGWSPRPLFVRSGVI